jgi:hypothetical protein
MLIGALDVEDGSCQKTFELKAGYNVEVGVCLER